MGFFEEYKPKVKHVVFFFLNIKPIPTMFYIIQCEIVSGTILHYTKYYKPITVYFEYTQCTNKYCFYYY